MKVNCSSKLLTLLLSGTMMIGCGSTTYPSYTLTNPGGSPATVAKGTVTVDLTTAVLANGVDAYRVSAWDANGNVVYGPYLFPRPANNMLTLANVPTSASLLDIVALRGGADVEDLRTQIQVGAGGAVSVPGSQLQTTYLNGAGGTTTATGGGGTTTATGGSGTTTATGGSGTTTATGGSGTTTATGGSGTTTATGGSGTTTATGGSGTATATGGSGTTTGGSVTGGTGGGTSPTNLSLSVNAGTAQPTTNQLGLPSTVAILPLSGSVSTAASTPLTVAGLPANFSSSLQTFTTPTTFNSINGNFTTSAPQSLGANNATLQAQVYRVPAGSTTPVPTGLTTTFSPTLTGNVASGTQLNGNSTGSATFAPGDSGFIAVSANESGSPLSGNGLTTSIPGSISVGVSP